MAAPATSGKSEHWGSRFGFIMAAVGSSVGLGNLWRFPFTAGENGGSAFILIYILCALLLGLPVLMAEYAVGRHGQRSAIGGIRHIATRENKSRAWTLVAWIGVIASLLIFSFYIVISAWVFDFIPQAFLGHFKGFDAATSAENFGNTLGSKTEILLYMTGFLILNVVTVARGIHGGIEKVAGILMPAFFLMLIGMVVFAVFSGDAAGAAKFLFQPDFSKVTFGTLLAAVGQAFFSISLGSCLMITYGAYLTRDTNIPGVSFLVAGADTFVALIAGFAIFPIVFAFGLDPAGGGGLFFVTMPVAFGQLPSIIGGAFFTLALFAAFTSSISLFEVGVSFLEEQRGIGRLKGAIGLGVVMFVLGTGYIFHGEFIDHVDFLTGQILLPLGGVLIALFAGWVVSKETLADELGRGPIIGIVRPLLRYVVPAALSFILIFGTLDTMQNNYGVQLPGFLIGLLGPNGS